MILGARALLIALLLVGSTGSVLCRSLCAQPPDFLAAAQARSAEIPQTAETAGPDHAGCHGAGATSPEPLSERSGRSCEGGCCTVLTRATTDPISTPEPISAGSPALGARVLEPAHTGPGPLRQTRPAARLKSPFQFRNPPLLI